MFSKGTIREYMGYLYGAWHRGKYVFSLPVILYGVILTWLNWTDIQHPDPMYSKLFMNERMLVLLPVGITIAVFYTLYPYIMEKGREILYLHKQLLVIELVLHLLWNVLVMTVAFLLTYVDIMPLPMLAYGKYVMILFLYFGISIGVIFATHSITMAMMCVVLFYLLQLIGAFGVSVLPHYMHWTYDQFAYIPEMLILFGIAYIGVWVGVAFYKRYDAYDNGYYLWVEKNNRKAHSNGVSVADRLRIGVAYIKSNTRLLLNVVLCMLIAVPVLVTIRMTTGDISEAEYAIQNAVELVYPMGFLFLLLIWMYPYIQEQGRELLYVKCRNQLPECLCLYLFTVTLMLFTVGLGYAADISNWLLFFAKNSILLLFYFGVAYGLLYTFGDITVMLIGYLIAILLYQMRLLGFGYISHYDLELYGIETCLQLIGYMKQYLIIGVLGIIIGYMRNQKYWSYN